MNPRCRLRNRSWCSSHSLHSPGDRRRRQPGGVLAEQALQRRAEVAGREAAQVQDRDHLADLRRPARVRRQDPRAELLPLAGLLVDALVVHARRPDRDRARPDRHLALPRAAVADHQPMPVLVDLIAETLDVLVDLGPQRRRDHPPRALPRELVQRDRDLLVALPDGEPANILHGVPSCRPSPASVFDQPGRYAAFSPQAPSTTFGYSPDEPALLAQGWATTCCRSKGQPKSRVNSTTRGPVDPRTSDVTRPTWRQRAQASPAQTSPSQRLSVSHRPAAHFASGSGSSQSRGKLASSTTSATMKYAVAQSTKAVITRYLDDHPGVSPQVGDRSRHAGIG